MSNLILENIEMRKVYSETLKELIEKDKNVYVVEADLSEAITTNTIGTDYPDNFVNCGIMEANMVGVASGLSLLGKIPFIHTFTPFATRRCYDQLYLSGGYAKTNIRILGSDTGIAAQYNGGTHTSFEDIALMREIPQATVMTATDSTMLKKLLYKIKDLYGIYYISTVRKITYKIYEETENFEIGKGKVLKDGNDLTIIATGIMVAEALKAAEELEKTGISVAVIDMFTIKPLDKDLIIEYAKKTKKIITAENHNILGGLGSAVAETLVENYPVPMKRVGVEERFGQVGTQDFLQKEYELTAEKIINKFKEFDKIF